MSSETPPEPLELNCPTCKKLIRWSDEFPFRPFCSERCKLIDLGEWASESHVIAGEPIIPNPDEE
jgi:hypothetical protein